MGIFSKKIKFSEFGFTHDYHTHLLPGVDDGFKSTENSIKALSIMKDNGYRNVVCTPHINPDVYQFNTEKLMKDRFEVFKAQIPKELDINISLGAEYMITQDFEKRDPNKLLRMDSNSVLIEMSYLYKSKNVEEAIFNISMAGLVPVLAHPERYNYMIGELKNFDKWYDMGCVFQLNLLSLSGVYGSASIKIIEYISKHLNYQYCGTDIHSLEYLEKIMNIRANKSFDNLIKGLQNNF